MNVVVNLVWFMDRHGEAINISPVITITSYS